MYLSHNHIIKLYPDNPLKDILKKDDLENFKPFYESYNKDLTDFFYIYCIGKNSCNHVSTLTCILKYNHSDILKYILKDYKPTLTDLWFFIINFIDIQHDILDKEVIFMDLYIYHDLGFEEFGIIINRLAKTNSWNLIEFLHKNGYRADDYEDFIEHIPINKISIYENFGYKKSANLYLKLLEDPEIDISKLDEFNGFTKEILKPENKDKIYELFKFRDLKTIKYLEKNGFKLNKICFQNAIDEINTSVIKHFYEEGYKFSSKQIKKLLLDFGKNFKSPISYISLENISILKLNIKKLKGKDSYEDDIINILKIAEKNGDKRFILNMIKFIKIPIATFICNGYYKLVNYFLEKFCDFDSFVLNPERLVRILRILIENDNINAIKLLNEYNIITKEKLIQINNNYNICNISIRNKADNVLEYFTNLGLRCNSEILRSHYYFKTSNDIKYLIDKLEQNKYPINKKLMLEICNYKNLNAIKYLVDKGIHPDTRVLTKALLFKCFNIINYLLTKNIKYNKKYYIDRILKKVRLYSYNIPIDKLIKIMVEKMDCTASSKSCDILVKTGYFKLSKYLEEKFNINPSEAYISIPSKYGLYLKNIKNLQEEYCNYINFYCEKTGKDSKTFYKIKSDDFFGNNYLLNPYPIFIENCLKINNIKLSQNQLITSIINSCTIGSIKYFESKCIYPTKDMFLELIFKWDSKGENGSKIKYLQDNYNFRLTLNDLHNFIKGNINFKYNYKYFTIDTLQYLDGEITPYTVQLIIEEVSINNNNIFRRNFYNKNFKIKLIQTGITKIGYDILKKNTRYKFVKNNIQIIDYNPQAYEIV
jgi:hypothetical protein